MSATIPYRFSESAFRVYEPAIREIVSRWPMPVTFDPSTSERTPGTYTARLRDAITGLIEYRHQTDIDVIRLAEIRPNFVIRHTKTGEVLVCDKAYKPFTQAPLAAATVAYKEAVDIEVQNEAEFFFLVRLAHQRAFSGPIRINGPVSAESIAEAEASFDVAIEQRADGLILV